MNDWDYLSLIFGLYFLATVCLAIVLVVLGLTGLAMPGRFRNLLNALPRNCFRFPLGVITTLTGVFLTIPSCCMNPSVINPGLGWEWNALTLLVGCVGIAVFLKGAVWLAFPGFVRRVVAFHTARSDRWFRLLGLTCLVLACVALVLWYAFCAFISDVLTSVVSGFMD